MRDCPAIKIVSQREAEDADLVVCGSAKYSFFFTDDVRTVCHDCGCPIVHRPHAPKRPIKVCVECALARLKGGTA